MESDRDLKSYENCCRTCMNEDSTMFDIFINTLNSANLADILTSCTRLSVSIIDDCLHIFLLVTRNYQPLLFYIVTILFYINCYFNH